MRKSMFFVITAVVVCALAPAANASKFYGYRLTGPNAMTSYFQQDSRWGGQRCLASSGCGLTAMAMIESSIGNKHLTPPMLARRYIGHGYSCPGGTWHTKPLILPLQFGRDYGLAPRFVGTNTRAVASGIKQGGQALALARHGWLTQGKGHFVVIRAVKGGKYFLADSNAKNRTKGTQTHGFTAAELLRPSMGHIVKMWTYEPRLKMRFIPEPQTGPGEDTLG